MIQIRSFRAVQDIESCDKYIEGHRKVLELYGVTKVTSNDVNWKDDPNTVVIIVESEMGKTLGGARIQIASEQIPLPIESAVGYIDPKIYEIVKNHTIHKTAEFCGLWNSREVAGFGIGSIILGRTGISLITRLGLGSLFALCSPATLKNCLNIGFQVLKEIGNEGTFYYPKEDLLATALVVPDPIALSNAAINDKERILSLRENPIQIELEKGPRGSVEINYNLMKL